MKIFYKKEKAFGISIGVCFLGLHLTIMMMKGNLMGIVYPTWKTVLALSLVAQFTVFLFWFLIPRIKVVLPDLGLEDNIIIFRRKFIEKTKKLKKAA